MSILKQLYNTVFFIWFSPWPIVKIILILMRYPLLFPLFFSLVSCPILFHFLKKYRHTSFYCTSLYWALQILHFLEIGVLWQSCIKQVYQHHFSKGVWKNVHFISLCHILVILTIFQAFSLVLYLLWWLQSVIFDVTVIVLGCHKLCPYKMANLILKCMCVLTMVLPFSHISPSSWTSLYPETQ